MPQYVEMPPITPIMAIVGTTNLESNMTRRLMLYGLIKRIFQ